MRQIRLIPGNSRRLDMVLPLSTRVPPIVETEPFAAVVIEGKSKGRVMSLREAVGQAIVCELDAVIITNHG